jgi:preprotein translocase subunit YajC
MSMTVAFMQSSGLGASIGSFVPIILIVGVFYFLVIAPANKQRRETEAMLSALKKGDRVLTSGGIYGTVQLIEEKVVHLRIADNVKIKVSRAAITGVVTEAE